MTATEPRPLAAEAPLLHETPLAYATRLAFQYTQEVAAGGRHDLGQFFTPPAVACFMAALATPPPTIRRVLDPGAGTGILAGALCEALPGGTGPVHLDAYELDPLLNRLCQLALGYATRWLAPRGIHLTFTVHAADFVLVNAGALTPRLLDQAPPGNYDLAIANPPYFKLPKSDPRARAAASIVHGQPNIYALFLAITGQLLAPGGVMVTITPRSFTTGDYFRLFRQYFFDTVTPEAVHLFQSRTATFQQDAVLQETVILRARKGSPAPLASVLVSTSTGTADLAERQVRPVPLESIVNVHSRQVLFHIPTGTTDDAIVGWVREWPNRLHRLGLDVSTGPVVAFRAAALLCDPPQDPAAAAPLLWLQHITALTLTWPLARFPKAQHIAVTPESRPLLVKNGNYVLSRRFTAKEERRRLIAAPLLAGQLPGEWLGLENHLNYIYRPRGTMTPDEVLGLAALLTSPILDRYFRVSNGNTQVNATELRALPLPPLPILVTLGAEIRRQELNPSDLAKVTADILRIPQALQELIDEGDDGAR